MPERRIKHKKKWQTAIDQMVRWPCIGAYGFQTKLPCVCARAKSHDILIMVTCFEFLNSNPDQVYLKGQGP